jgi:hypothetical protein
VVVIFQDKVNWKKFVFISMFLSVLLLNLGKENIAYILHRCSFIAKCCTYYIIVDATIYEKQSSGATGLSLGLAIVLAGLPTYIQQFREIQNTKFLYLLSSMYSFVFLIT